MSDPVDETWQHIVEEVGTGGIADLVEATAEDSQHAEEIYGYITDAIFSEEE